MIDTNRRRTACAWTCTGRSHDKAGAKTELTTISELGNKFPRQGEVAELLKTL